MKNLLKKILEKKLRFLAKKILKKYQPDVIGITGSVGKTSAKEAIYTVLAAKFPSRENIKNYNNEIGVPLTIIGAESGRKSIFSWLKVFMKALALIVATKPYPKILVLEMAADKPGDLSYLTDFIPLKVAVVTAIGPVHLEFFGKIENIVREKSQLVAALPKEGFALLSADDELVLGMKEKTKATLSTYGFSAAAEVKASEPQLSYGEGGLDGLEKRRIKGLSFKVSFEGSTTPFFLPGVLGEHQVYSALAATAVGLAYGLNLVGISEALRNFKSPPGRMNLIQGIKGTLVIDDSYNSSPKAALAALDVLDKINLDEGIPDEAKPAALKKLTQEGKRFLKFAVLGDMAELGEFTKEGHEMVGEKVAGIADVLITVGEKGKIIAKKAVKKGMHEVQVFSFDYAAEAGRFLQDRIHKGDIILIKGSQVVRMEKAVKEIMTEPLRAGELLCRQGSEWENR
ncbi:MAG: UDP-N-acetylmuramoyl-tripeptide--D-alanyl-D-alanine ligase [Patescibacteria group bacterium]